MSNESDAQRETKVNVSRPRFKSRSSSTDNLVVQRNVGQALPFRPRVSSFTDSLQKEDKEKIFLYYFF